MDCDGRHRPAPPDAVSWLTTSAEKVEKVEKVMNTLMKPVIVSRRHSGDIEGWPANYATSTPIME
jgi:hypothetical protein